ncbi:MAG: FG-GAP repeat domain-containing protein [Acidobacteriota bacterium]
MTTWPEQLLGAALGVLALVGVHAAVAGSADRSGLACPPAGIYVDAEAASTSWTVPLPGRLVGLAALRQTTGGRRLFALVIPTPPPTGHRARAVQKLRAAGRLEGIDGGPARIQEENDAGEVVRSVMVTLAGSSHEKASECPTPSPLHGPALFELRTGETVRAVPFDVALTDEVSALLALDLDGDGAEQLILEASGQLMEIRLSAADTAAVQTPFLTDAELDLRVEEPTQVSFPAEPVAIRSPLEDEDRPARRSRGRGRPIVAWSPGAGPAHVRVTGLGELRLYTPGGGSATWPLAARIPLPLRATGGASDLELVSSQVRTVGTTAAGTTILAAGPVPHSSGRLRTLIVKVGGDEPATQDAWSQVGEDDVVDRSGYLLIDDVPHLWVVTHNEKGVEFFGGSDRFRLFALSADRTRAGSSAVLDVKENSLEIRRDLVVAQDADGDGRDDLVIVGRKDHVVLSVVRQQETGRFARSTHRQVLAGSGDPLAYIDLDGDGTNDLVVGDGDWYRIHAGLPAGSTTGARVTAVARWTAARLNPGEAVPKTRVACAVRAWFDLDGDGLDELLCPGRDGYARTAIKIVRFNSTSS